MSELEQKLRELVEKMRPLLPVCDKHNYQCECNREFEDYFSELEALLTRTPASEPLSEREKALEAFVKKIVEYDHQKYCRSDGTACVATCVNGRAALAAGRSQSEASA